MYGDITDELKRMVGVRENILYEGKPDKKCYVLEGIFNPMLLFSLLWLAFDLKFIMELRGTGEAFSMIPFFLLHLMPVWSYLAGVLGIVKKYQNTGYIVTDRAVYVSGGVFTKQMNSATFAECSGISLHRGFFDQLCGAGDIVIATGQRTAKGASVSLTVGSIREYRKVYDLVKSLQSDGYSDAMYPGEF